MPAAAIRARSLLHLPHISPSATAIVAIVALTLSATIFIYTSVAQGFHRYNAAITMIRTQREVLTDLLDEDTSANGYFNTRQRVFIAQYRKTAASTPHDIERLQTDAVASGLPVAALIVDGLKESYFQYTVDVKHLLTLPTVTDIDQEIPRKLQVAMRDDLGQFQGYAKELQDSTIARVRYTVLGGSLGLLLAAIALGLLGIIGESARRREQRALALELDARNRELERSNSALQDFAYMASHDLQEPLRTVASYTELLRKRYGTRLGSEGTEFIAYAADAAKRMELLITALLEYSRVASTRAFEKVESSTELDVALRNLATRIEESGAVIEAGAMPPVLATPGQLALVFQNLLGNALKYRADRSPVIHVGAELHGGQWLFSITDNGIGIAPEHQERIFKMFQRLHARSEYDGAGIGLALVKRIVELHGGRVWAESTAGEGSTFSFTIRSIGGK